MPSTLIGPTRRSDERRPGRAGSGHARQICEAIRYIAKEPHPRAVARPRYFGHRALSRPHEAPSVDRDGIYNVDSMRIARLECVPVSVPYAHRERSSQVKRDFVCDILGKAATDDGLCGCMAFKKRNVDLMCITAGDT